MQYYVPATQMTSIGGLFRPKIGDKQVPGI